MTEFDAKQKVVCYWMLDFIRAVNERNFLIKIIFTLCLGRYAKREFIGAIEFLHDMNLYPLDDYGLYNCEYHKDKKEFMWWSKKC